MDLLDLTMMPLAMMTFATKPTALRALALAVLTAFAASGAARAAESGPAGEAALYRITVLTRSSEYLIVSGGDTLRVAPDCASLLLPPGTVAVVRLDPSGKVVELQRSTGNERVADKLPASALAIDPRSARANANGGSAVFDVTVTLVVAVPADTPPGDDLYVSTARSGWNAAELRMERLDPQHWTLAMKLPANVPMLYRYSRGSFATLEADRSGQLFPPRKIVPKAGLVEHDSILRFSDTN